MKVWYLFLMLFTATSVYAFSPEDDFMRKSRQTNQTGMLVLGSWAMANITVGAIGMTRTDGAVRHFHQMNAAWNVVNLGIAGFALWNFSQQQIEAIPWQDFADDHQRIKRLYLINAGLDVLYMAAGVYMWHRSSKSVKRADLLKGFGQSVVLQGGFLLIFDAAMYLLQQNNEKMFPGLVGLSLSF